MSQEVIVTWKLYVRSLKNLVQTITIPSAILNNNVSQQVASSATVSSAPDYRSLWDSPCASKFSDVLKRFFFVLTVLKQNQKWKQCVCNILRCSFYSAECIFFLKFREICREQRTCWNFSVIFWEYVEILASKMVIMTSFPPPTEGLHHVQEKTEAFVHDKSYGVGTLYIASE